MTARALACGRAGRGPGRLRAAAGRAAGRRRRHGRHAGGAVAGDARSNRANAAAAAAAGAGADRGGARRASTMARAPLLPQVNATLNYPRATNNFAPQAGGTSLGMNATPDAVVQHLQLLPQQHHRVAAASGTSARPGRGASPPGRTRTPRRPPSRPRCCRRTCRSGRRSSRRARRATRSTVARETLANQNKHVEQIRAFTEVGTEPEIDLLQALTDQANAEVSLINAQNDYATARALLNQAMGVDAPARYEVTGGPSPAIAGEQSGARHAGRRGAAQPARAGGEAGAAARAGGDEQGDPRPLRSVAGGDRRRDVQRPRHRQPGLEHQRRPDAGVADLRGVGDALGGA